jgi:hypothetical protein
MEWSGGEKSLVVTEIELPANRPSQTGNSQATVIRGLATRSVIES